MSRLANAGLPRKKPTSTKKILLVVVLCVLIISGVLIGRGLLNEKKEHKTANIVKIGVTTSQTSTQTSSTMNVAQLVHNDTTTSISNETTAIETVRDVLSDVTNTTVNFISQIPEELKGMLRGSGEEKGEKEENNEPAEENITLYQGCGGENEIPCRGPLEAECKETLRVGPDGFCHSMDENCGFEGQCPCGNFNNEVYCKSGFGIGNDGRCHEIDGDVETSRDIANCGRGRQPPCESLETNAPSCAPNYIIGTDKLCHELVCGPVIAAEQECRCWLMSSI